jgi:hypothetical protein
VKTLVEEPGLRSESCLAKKGELILLYLGPADVLDECEEVIGTHRHVVGYAVGLRPTVEWRTLPARRLLNGCIRGSLGLEQGRTNLLLLRPDMKRWRQDACLVALRCDELPSVEEHEVV